jgi:hypothetical protein
MYVRIATFEGVDVDAATSSFDRARESVLGFVKELAGFEGILELADTSGGKVQTLYFFDSEESMRNAEQPLDQELPKRIPAEIMQSFTGRRTAVERFEVVGREWVRGG